MDDLFHLFAAGLFLAALLTSISIWAPRRFFVKAAAVGLAALFVPLSYAGLSGLLSRPKPASLEWARKTIPEAAVLGSSIREGEGIYLWLQMPNVGEPRAYVLPWNRQMAQQLQEATREAEKSGTGLRMRLPFERSLDNREPKFYALPQPAPPLKDAVEPPTYFKHPSTDA
ncbi:MAG: hypothetical protein HY057_15060 [Rhodospirillales bacterium]|nr:hypothetical protein [Rhodospirillales bacterium]